MKNILVPIGTSANSHETLQYAVHFAKDFDCRIYVMEVFNVTALAGNLTNVEEKVAKSSKEHLKEVIDRIDSGEWILKSQPIMAT
jgi:nucleotide-binding universal stress UspA family protein